MDFAKRIMKGQSQRAQMNNNTAKRRFQHLSAIERGRIEAYHNEGYGVTAIAEKTGRDKSTISRELLRGTVAQRRRNPYESRNPKVPEFIEYTKYFAQTGETVYKNNRKRSRKPKKLESASEFIKYADQKMLTEKWAPDVICGRAALSGEWRDKPSVCAKTLYNYINAGLMKTKNLDLWLKVRRKPNRVHSAENKRVLGESIEKRPVEIQNRQEAGHWEIDTVIGRKTDKTAILTLVERKTRLQIAEKLKNRGSKTVDEKVSEIYGSFGENAETLMKSLTGDNGSEFSGLSESARCPVYFCHPYSSWEKGTNERHNGLLRRFILKGKSIDGIPEEMIVQAARMNNNLPRKILGYKTPAEAFADETATLENGLTFRLNRF